MLTARAAGIVLRNISQVDTFKAAWMEEYFTAVGFVRIIHRRTPSTSSSGCPRMHAPLTRLAAPARIALSCTV
jgi:hypothetical protein